MKRVALFGALVLLLFGGWLRRGELVRLAPLPFIPVAAHDQYAAALRLSGAAATADGIAWQAAANGALADAAAY
jgi:hypothetical protein